MISILFIFLFWAMTIAITIFLSEASGRYYITGDKSVYDELDTNYWDAFVELSEDEALEFV